MRKQKYLTRLVHSVNSIPEILKNRRAVKEKMSSRINLIAYTSHSHLTAELNENYVVTGGSQVV